MLISDAAEIGLDAAASGMQLSSQELSKLSCRNLTIGGVNGHVRVGPLSREALGGVAGYTVIRATAPGANAFLGVQGNSPLIANLR